MKLLFAPLLTGIAGTSMKAMLANTTGDSIKLGLEVLLLGLGVVFAVLMIIWAILVLFRKGFAGADKAEGSAVAAESSVQPVPAPVHTAEPVAKAVSETTDTDEAALVAAITAAIAVVLDQPQTAFRVVSYRRTASKN